MRLLVLVLPLLVAASAAAQPLSFQIKADVPQGQTPLLRLRANQKVADVRLELERNDGKKFLQRRASMARGQTVVVKIGDGAAGRAKYRAELSAKVAGKPWSHRFTFETLVRGKLEISYDSDHLYLDRCRLEFKLSRPAARAEVTVYGEDGRELGTGKASFSGEPANKWLAIKWRQDPKKRVMKMRLRVVADNGLESTVELIPWSVTIDHEDVNFATGSAVIEAGERAKLDASFVKITEIVKRSNRFMNMRLYIAGHTDTVGSGADNRKLSRARARAIAGYFRRKGLGIPIAFAGFGEQVLKIGTPDSTDNAANRRVDYVLGPAAGAPPFSSRYRKTGTRWQTLR
jgi:outer membrane protein OmpA-like peptidoglycan-associated protein